SVACSGAAIDHLIGQNYDGPEAPAGSVMNPPQIQQVITALCPQGSLVMSNGTASCTSMPSIDAFLVSIGGNDAGFGNIIRQCTMDDTIQRCCGDSAVECSLNPLEDNTHSCSWCGDFVNDTYAKICNLYSPGQGECPYLAQSAILPLNSQGYPRLAS